MLSYGTAGFRGLFDSVKEIVEPVALFMVVSSLKTGKSYGLQFTASHNVATDHGMKFCQPDGSPIHHKDEMLVEEVVKLYETKSILKLYEWAKRQLVDIDYKERQPGYCLGGDNRPGFNDLKEDFIDHWKYWCFSLSVCAGVSGIYPNITTPMLHYLTKYFNESKYELVNENHYMKKSEMKWIRFLDMMPDKTYSKSVRVIDCAHGVGNKLMDSLSRCLEMVNIRVQFVNERENPSLLNQTCGADYIHKSLEPPHHLPYGVWLNRDTYGITFDGDADRILYFVGKRDDLVSPWEEDYSIELIDGDRIMTLWATTLYHLLEKANIRETFDIRLIHTAYSNGGAIEYWDRMGWKHEYATTGVKNLHPKAEEADIGIYFETNGHGTILVKREVLDFLRQSTNEFLQILYSWLNLSNQLVGDAYRNVLLTEASLLILDMPITHEFYEERCYENMKIYGLDRSIFEVGQEDRVVLKPDGIQLKINEMIGRFGGRMILRPSGTEDLVRLYIENNSKERIISMKNEILPILNSLRK